MEKDMFVSARFVSQMLEQSYFKLVSAGFKKIVLRPWMKVREIELIKSILVQLKPQQCLEWGAGFSTLYYPKHLDPNAKWTSIEHEKDWFMKIKDMNKRENVNIHFVAPNHHPWTDPLGDGSYSDLSDYIKYPDTLGHFDFILIDGRARVECMKKASELLSPRGIVVLHDANRKMYEDPWKLFRYQALFRDSREIVGGLWIGSQNVDINTLLDVNGLQRLWNIYRKIGSTRIGGMLRL